MLNTAIIMGRLSEKPELRKTQSDLSVTSFTVAVDKPTKPGQEKQTNWIDCVAWRQTADFITQYFGKGDMIAVTGSIQTRMYTDKNGNNRKAVEVVVDQASFCEGKKKRDETAQEQPQNAPTAQPEQRPARTPEVTQGQQTALPSPPRPDYTEFEEVGTDDDLPF